MKQIIVGFGLLIISLLVLFRLAEYGRFRMQFSSEVYIAFFSILFLVIGIVISRKMFRKEIIMEKEIFVEVSQSSEADPKQVARLGISKREHEILLLISDGLSNQQIAGKLFVSENTIKKHISNLFLKMDVERRTEAVKKSEGIEIDLIIFPTT